MFHAESDGGLQILLAQWICCEKDDVTITSELTEAFYRDVKKCLSSFHLCFYLALFVYVCVSLSLFFSLSFLSSSVRMPRLQAPDNVDTNTCILQGALGSTEALQLSAHSVHIFQRMG